MGKPFELTAGEIQLVAGAAIMLMNYFNQIKGERINKEDLPRLLSDARVQKLVADAERRAAVAPFFDPAPPADLTT